MKGKYEIGGRHALSNSMLCVFAVACTSATDANVAESSAAVTTGTDLSSARLSGKVEDWSRRATGTVEVHADTDDSIIAKSSIGTDGVFEIQLPTENELKAETGDLSDSLCPPGTLQANPDGLEGLGVSFHVFQQDQKAPIGELVQGDVDSSGYLTTAVFIYFAAERGSVTGECSTEDTDGTTLATTYTAEFDAGWNAVKYELSESLGKSTNYTVQTDPSAATKPWYLVSQ